MLNKSSLISLQYQKLHTNMCLNNIINVKNIEYVFIIYRLIFNYHERAFFVMARTKTAFNNRKARNHFPVICLLIATYNASWVRSREIFMNSRIRIADADRDGRNHCHPETRT